MRGAEPAPKHHVTAPPAPARNARPPPPVPSGLALRASQWPPEPWTRRGRRAPGDYKSQSAPRGRRQRSETAAGWARKLAPGGRSLWCPGSRPLCGPEGPGERAVPASRAGPSPSRRLPGPVRWPALSPPSLSLPICETGPTLKVKLDPQCAAPPQAGPGLTGRSGRAGAGQWPCGAGQPARGLGRPARPRAEGPAPGSKVTRAPRTLRLGPRLRRRRRGRHHTAKCFLGGGVCFRGQVSRTDTSRERGNRV